LKSEARNKDTKETKEAIDKMRGERKEKNNKEADREKQTNKNCPK